MKWTVGIKKTLWQYFDDIEAETEKEAKEIAFSRLDEEEMHDYGNGVNVSDCYPNK